MRIYSTSIFHCVSRNIALAMREQRILLLFYQPAPTARSQATTNTHTHTHISTTRHTKDRNTHAVTVSSLRPQPGVLGWRAAISKCLTHRYARTQSAILFLLHLLDLDEGVCVVEWSLWLVLCFLMQILPPAVTDRAKLASTVSVCVESLHTLCCLIFNHYFSTKTMKRQKWNKHK